MKKPRSRAKTAYGLLTEIRALILAEPKRYNQCVFIARPDYYRIDEDVPLGFPECGTVGCVAGWVGTLKAPKPLTYKRVAPFAQRVLGLRHMEADELFSPSTVDGYPQTLTHAESGAQHIARFQKKYAKQLKAKRV